MTMPYRQPQSTTTAIVPSAQSTWDRIEFELLRDPRLQSAHTRRAYRSDLRAFEHWRQGQPLTRGAVEAYTVQLQRDDRSPNSINRALAAVRWWARRVADLAYDEPLPEDQRDEIVLQATRVATIRDISGQRELRGRHIDDDEFKALLAACQRDAHSAGLRDAALFVVGWATGLRRSEITSIRVGDIKSNDNSTSIHVRGKGNKTRQVYLAPASWRWVRRWINHRTWDAGSLFCRIRKGGKLVLDRRLSEEGLAIILRKRASEAALSEPITWHDFRRTFAGNLLDQGVDLVTVQKLLGHSSPTTTSNYDRRGEETKRRAVGKISIPTAE
jgi:site-specific recombinase XerD